VADMTTTGARISSARPWLVGAAASFVAGAWQAQIAIPIAPSASVLGLVRTMTGFAWLGVIVVLLLQAATRRLSPPSFTPPMADGAARPVDGKVAVAADQFMLSWPETLRRAAMVSAVAFPRYARVGDPAGFLVASLWLVALLVCAFVYVEPLLGPRRSNVYWLAALALLLPWGAGLISAHWPPFT
jgi:hypothetical protein